MVFCSAVSIGATRSAPVKDPTPLVYILNVRKYTPKCRKIAKYENNGFRNARKDQKGTGQETIPLVYILKIPKCAPIRVKWENRGCMDGCSFWRPLSTLLFIGRLHLMIAHPDELRSPRLVGRRAKHNATDPIKMAPTDSLVRSEKMRTRKRSRNCISAYKPGL